LVLADAGLDWPDGVFDCPDGVLERDFDFAMEVPSVGRSLSC